MSQDKQAKPQITQHFLGHSINSSFRSKIQPGVRIFAVSVLKKKVSIRLYVSNLYVFLINDNCGTDITGRYILAANAKNKNLQNKQLLFSLTTKNAKKHLQKS